MNFFDLTLLRGRQCLVLEFVLNVELLQAAEPLEAVGDFVEGLEHLRFELRLNCADREPLLHIALVDVALADGLAACNLAIADWFAAVSIRLGEAGICGGRPGWPGRSPRSDGAQGPPPMPT